MKLELLAVGRMKDAGLAAAIDTYVKRLRPMMPLTIVEPRDLDALRRTMDGSPRPRIVLDERGEQLTTTALAHWLGELRDRGTRTCTFAIGDAHGFEDRDRHAADRVLALSAMTLPHRLARLVLIEQLYRAACILHGHPYHH